MSVFCHKSEAQDKCSALLEITPACAGKSLRSCPIRSKLLGSPPRVRGKGNFCSRGSRGSRITPACAGKSVMPRILPRSLRDHPRVCGEKGVFRAQRGHLAGSPARVRGKDILPHGRCVSPRITPACAGKAVPRLCGDGVVGITPACAGKSQHKARTDNNRLDHPRVCGEKSTTTRTCDWPKGSPPRVRGRIPLAY